MLPQGSQVSIRVVRGLLGYLSSQCRGIGPHHKLRQEPQCFSPVLTRILGTYGVSTGESGLLTSCVGYLRISLDSLQGNTDSSRVEVGNSGFLSSSDSDLGVPMEIQLGSQTLFRV